MEIKKFIKILTGAFFLAIWTAVYVPAASAQIRIGASYQLRNSTPKRGFGISVEPSVYQLSHFEIAARGYFAMTNHDGNVTIGGSTFNRNIKYYDFGLGAVGRYKLGIVDPYVVLGIGFNSYKVSSRGYSNIKSSYLYNGSVGLEINPIPFVKPYIEYQFTKSTVHNFQVQFFNPDNAVGKLMFGINIKL